MILSIRGQCNGLIRDYMLSMLYTKICPTLNQKPTNLGNNTSYPIGSTQQHEKVSRMSGSATDYSLSPARIDNMKSRIKSSRLFCPNFSRKNYWKKEFTGISGHELIEYLMVWYGKIT